MSVTPTTVQDLVRHGKLWIDKSHNVRLHYVTAGSGNKVAVLVHGAPQTWYAWRHTIQPLVDAGYRLIMPDYRGAGGSSKPVSGYDKWTMAQDIHTLVHDHLEVREPITLVGHDIGMMVTQAYALRYRDEVASYIGMEAPVPGTSQYEEQKGSKELWHFNFHAARDVPEILTEGKERFYIKRFFDDRVQVLLATSARCIDGEVGGILKALEDDEDRQPAGA
ncbi:alpha/beta fold hydrolase [Streptomyces griseoviridis]|uniref:AB hydrolase-1 domain-containing protein n=1 Tax=Streptomyces griseoviridis TaxID=45398 RepID=A0A918L8B6_STRGD|nr:alpha/beta fold hydrolase [Streptomyces niveoruber]GGS18041.1 hypothetical protein GCM10010238_02670 [Streptomyces niveoruber]